MKRLIIFIIAVILTACSGANPNYNNIVDSSATIVEDKVFEIAFDYSAITNMHYLEDDNVFVIEYNDPDVFDYETLAFITGRDKWYGEYVECVVDEHILDDFVYNKQNYENTNDFWRKESLNSQYKIVEHLIRYLDGTVDAVYEIELNKEEDSE